MGEGLAELVLVPVMVLDALADIVDELEVEAEELELGVLLPDAVDEDEVVDEKVDELDDVELPVDVDEDEDVPETDEEALDVGLFVELPDAVDE